MRQDKKWIQELKEFIQPCNIEVPHAVSRTVFDKVRADLNPPMSRVFAKVATIHILVGAVSLIFCPQLGVGPLGGGHGVMALLMSHGDRFCAAFCGSVFLGLSSLFSAILLKPEELRRADSYGFAYIPLLSAVSFSALMLMGGEGEKTTYLFWLLGAIIGGWVLLKVSTLARFKIVRKIFA